MEIENIVYGVWKGYRKVNGWIENESWFWWVDERLILIYWIYVVYWL